MIKSNTDDQMMAPKTSDGRQWHDSLDLMMKWDFFSFPQQTCEKHLQTREPKDGHINRLQMRAWTYRLAGQASVISEGLR